MKTKPTHDWWTTSEPEKTPREIIQDAQTWARRWWEAATFHAMGVAKEERRHWPTMTLRERQEFVGNASRWMESWVAHAASKGQDEDQAKFDLVMRIIEQAHEQGMGERRPCKTCGNSGEVYAGNAVDPAMVEVLPCPDCGDLPPWVQWVE